MNVKFCVGVGYISKLYPVKVDKSDHHLGPTAYWACDTPEIDNPTYYNPSHTQASAHAKVTCHFHEVNIIGDVILFSKTADEQLIMYASKSCGPLCSGPAFTAIVNGQHYRHKDPTPSALSSCYNVRTSGVSDTPDCDERCETPSDDFDPAHTCTATCESDNDICSTNCDDAHPCTDDYCDPSMGCRHQLAAACFVPLVHLFEDDECGNGVTDAGEQCDDGNLVSGDGCSATCRVESCFDCAGAPSVCNAITTCIEGDGCCPSTCYGLDSDCPIEQPVAGTKILMRDSVDWRKRKIIFMVDGLSIDPVSVNPTRDGALVQVYNKDTGESVCLPLPSDGWLASGTAPYVSYRYADSGYINGPCKSATLTGGRLRIKCSGAKTPLAYSLDESAQLSIGVNFTSGTTTYCALFGGTITRNSGTDPPISGGKGIFAATNAPAPAVCPTAPPTCTASMFP